MFLLMAILRKNVEQFSYQSLTLNIAVNLLRLKQLRKLMFNLYLFYSYLLKYRKCRMSIALRNSRL